MKKPPIYIYSDGYLFCIRGYHVIAKAWGTIRFTNPPKPMFDEKEWDVLGPCDGSCKSMLTEIPKGVIRRIRKLKRNKQAAEIKSGQPSA